MAVIHRRTLTPAKPELPAGRLPARPWSRGGQDGAGLRGGGGFRLDGPAGEVGVEFGVYRVGDRALSVPMTYRGAPLEGGGAALIGALEHGVPGRRRAYDACADPVAVGQVLALMTGRAVAQAQNVSDTPDPAVVAALQVPGQRLEVEELAVRHTADATHGARYRVAGSSAGGASAGAVPQAEGAGPTRKSMLPAVLRSAVVSQVASCVRPPTVTACV